MNGIEYLAARVSVLGATDQLEMFQTSNTALGLHDGGPDGCAAVHDRTRGIP